MSAEAQAQEACSLPPYDQILPDGVTSHDHPLMARALLPLSDFDRPELHRFADADLPDYLANGGLTVFLAKQCAGLAHEWRITADDFRRALATGEFSHKDRVALDWAFSGMWTECVFVPQLMEGTRVTIFQMTRLLWRMFDGDAFGAHAYLNQWADNPSHPLPAVSDLTRTLMIPAGISQHYLHGLISRERAEADLVRFPWPPDLKWDPFIGPPERKPRHGKGRGLM